CSTWDSSLNTLF
nr:immunoglobulin light chain junction region [Macaca mulatta]